MKPPKPLKRSRIKRKPPVYPYSNETIEALKQRSKGLCEASDGVHEGTDIHHIKSRARGGKHNLENLVWLCRDVHRWVHDHPKEANKQGLLDHSWD